MAIPRFSTSIRRVGLAIKDRDTEFVWRRIRVSLAACIRWSAESLSVLANLWWTLPAVAVMRVISPWKRFRTGSLYAAKIGHFAMDGAVYAAEAKIRSLRGERVTDLFWLEGKVSNSAWSDMVRRELRIRSRYETLDKMNRLLPGGSRTKRSRHINGNGRDVGGLLARGRPAVALSDTVIRQGRQWLEAHGWSGQKFICLHIRDDVFHVSERHSFRNSDPSRYQETIKYLADSGYWVIRTGRRARHPLPYMGPSVLDYPFSREQDDNVDVFLFASAQLTISTGSGPDAISAVFGVPILFINFIPLSHIWSFAYSLTNPKRLYWSDTGDELTITEYFNLRYLYSDEFRAGGVSHEELQPLEIVRTTEEMLKYLGHSGDDRTTPTQYSSELRGYLKDVPGIADLHGWIHPRAGLSSEFTSRHASRS